MIIIPQGQTFLRRGAIVPDERELGAIIHALIEERDRVVRGHGDHYGHMTIHELSSFIAELQKYQKERGV